MEQEVSRKDPRLAHSASLCLKTTFSLVVGFQVAGWTHNFSSSELLSRDTFFLLIEVFIVGRLPRGPPDVSFSAAAEAD